MPQFLAVLLAAIALAGTVPARAPQTPRPNFSGVWVALPDPAPPQPRKPDELTASCDWSSPVTLTQNGATLAVAYQTYARSHALRTFTYRLDGTETANVLTGSVDPQGRASTAVWETQRLILADTVDWPMPDGRGGRAPQKRVDRRILSIESPGVLLVECSTSIGDRTSAVRQVRFKRTADRQVPRSKP